MTEDKTPKYQHDVQWKTIITELFEDFVAFFLKDLYPLIDFSVKEVSLEQEFHKLTADIEKGKIVNDKLFKVRLKSGKMHVILIHVEIQSYRDDDFPERMFKYFYRIRDKYGLDVTAIAIYTDNDIPKNYNRYIYDYQGTRNTYEFNTFLVRDQIEDELLLSENPFALAVLAAKLLNRSKKDKWSRYKYKLRLMTLALKRGYSKNSIRHLLTFIHYLLILSKEMNEKLTFEISENIEKTTAMNLPQPEAFAVWADTVFKLQNGESMAEYKNRSNLEYAEKLLKMGVSSQKIADALELPLKTVTALQTK